MASKKRHWVTAIVRLLERDAELSAQGLTAEEVAGEAGDFNGDFV